MKYYLLQRQRGPGLPFVINLDKEEIIVGRQTFATLGNFPEISRSHASFQRTDNNKWFVKDLDSLNGTFVNDIRLSKSLHTLNIGDIIGFGVAHSLENEGFVCVLCAHPDLNITNKIKTEVIDITDSECEAPNSREQCSSSSMVSPAVVKKETIIPSDEGDFQSASKIDFKHQQIVSFETPIKSKCNNVIEKVSPFFQENCSENTHTRQQITLDKSHNAVYQSIEKSFKSSSENNDQVNEPKYNSKAQNVNILKPSSKLISSSIINNVENADPSTSLSIQAQEITNSSPKYMFPAVTHVKNCTTKKPGLVIEVKQSVVKLIKCDSDHFRWPSDVKRPQKYPKKQIGFRRKPVVCLESTDSSSDDESVLKCSLESVVGPEKKFKANNSTIAYTKGNAFLPVNNTEQANKNVLSKSQFSSINNSDESVNVCTIKGETIKAINSTVVDIAKNTVQSLSADNEQGNKNLLSKLQSSSVMPDALNFKTTDILKTVLTNDVENMVKTTKHFHRKRLSDLHLHSNSSSDESAPSCAVQKQKIEASISAIADTKKNIMKPCLSVHNTEQFNKIKISNSSMATINSQYDLHNSKDQAISKKIKLADVYMLKTSNILNLDYQNEESLASSRRNKKSTALKANVNQTKLLDSKEKFDGFGFSQIEEVIAISDDDSYLDFKSSQDYININPLFIKTECYDEPDSSSVECPLDDAIDNQNLKSKSFLSSKENSISTDDNHNNNKVMSSDVNQPNEINYESKNEGLDYQMTDMSENIENIKKFVCCPEKQLNLENRLTVDDQNLNPDLSGESSSDDCKSSDIEEQEKVLYPSGYALVPKVVDKRFSENNDNGKDCITKKAMEETKAKTAGRTLLTEPKPMIYRSRAKRGREEWFIEKNHSGKCETTNASNLTVCQTKEVSTKKQSHTSSRKHCGVKSNPIKRRKKSNLREMINKKGYNSQVLNKASTSHVKSIEQTRAQRKAVQNKLKLNHLSAAELEKQSLKSEMIKKRNNKVKKRPENFGSRMNFLVSEAHKTNVSSSINRKDCTLPEKNKWSSRDVNLQLKIKPSVSQPRLIHSENSSSSTISAQPCLGHQNALLVVDDKGNRSKTCVSANKDQWRLRKNSSYFIDQKKSRIGQVSRNNQRNFSANASILPNDVPLNTLHSSGLASSSKSRVSAYENEALHKDNSSYQNNSKIDIKNYQLNSCTKPISMLNVAETNAPHATGYFQSRNPHLKTTWMSKDPRLKKYRDPNLKLNTSNSSPLENQHLASVSANLVQAKPNILNSDCYTKLSFTVDFDHMLLKILCWRPSWLKEQISMNKPPPDVCKGSRMLPLSYESLDMYVSAFLSMIMLETWEMFFREWKGIPKDTTGLKGNKFYFMVSSVSRKDCLLEINCESVVNPAVSYSPLEGHIAIVELREKSKKEIVPVFGYITKHKIEPLHNNLNSRWYRIPKDWLQNASFWKFTFKTRRKDITFDQGQLMKAYVLCYLKNRLRLADSLKYLTRSRLTRDILNPREKTFQVSSPGRNMPAILGPYNSSQTDAILAISEVIWQPHVEPKIVLLQGPPGTGKTHTILGLLQHLLCGKGPRKKILVTAPSNAAVDEVGRRLIQLQRDHSGQEKQKLLFVRVGQNKQMHSDILPYSLDNLVSKLCQSYCEKTEVTAKKDILDVEAEISSLKKEISEMSSNHVNEIKIKETKLSYCQKRYEFLKTYSCRIENKPSERQSKLNVLRDADIVLSTLSSCRQNILDYVFGENKKLNFSCCIIDEATQCTEPEILQPLMFSIHKLILVGDHKQLPATVNSQLALKYNFERSLYERFHEYFLQQSNKSPILMLTEQFRMHSQICCFPSNYFYKNMLCTSPSTDIKYENFPLRPYTIFDILRGQESNARSSKTNIPEALVIEKICQQLLYYVPSNCTIGIITPYQGQRDLYKKAFFQDYNFKRIEINTVDGFQGREKDVIVVSCVRANSTSGGIGFLSCKKRLNVAITRAKQSLIICGHMNSLINDSNWANLIDDSKKRGAYVCVTSPEDISIVMHKIVKM